MNKYLKDTEEFHDNFNLPINEEIVDDNLEDRKLRLSLIFEEMVELAHAMGCTKHLESLCDKHKGGSHTWLFNGEESSDGNTYNKIETLDALGDLQYVTSGSVISLGYKNVFDNAFTDIHISNMTKLCNNTQEADDTIKYYKKERGEVMELSILPKGDKFIVQREDGKIMKNKYYEAVDLKKYI